MFNPIYQPLHSGRIWPRSIFKRSLTGLNSEFSISWTSYLTKAEEPSLPYYLPIAARGIIGFIPFPRVLVLCEMQSVSSRIWTRVVVSISYDDNHYTTGTSVKFLCLIVYRSSWVIQCQSIIVEEEQCYNLIHSWEYNEVHSFSKGKISKVSLIAQFEFELACFEDAVLHIRYYAKMTPHNYSLNRATNVLLLGWLWN